MKKNSKKKEVLPGKSYQETEDPILDLFSDDFAGLNSSRRNFLKILGYSFASAAVLAACKRPVRKAIPYAVQPPELVPRNPLYYASTYSDGHDYCNIIVKTIDGRPIKIEGNALSPFNGEGTTARIQASVLSLYDDTRQRGPSINGTAISWEELDKQLSKDLDGVKGNVVLLTPTIISPTTTRLINSFGSRFPGFRWVQYDAVSYSAITAANEASFGRPVFPDYHFERADVVLAVNCDFLGTWGTPVHFIPGYVSRRKLNDGKTDMLYHVQYESGMTLTGSNADKRIKIKPSEEKLLLSNLYNSIAGRSGAETVQTTAFRDDLSDLAGRLLAAKGRSVVLSGTNDPGIQILTNAINNLLGNYGNTIDLSNPLRIAAGRDSEMPGLVNDMAEGRIGALFMYAVNPAYDYPENQKFVEALGRIPVTVNMAVSLNETSGKAKYECPVSHFLESWDDAEIIAGQLSLVQPCINPIFDTRQLQESLLKWSGNNQAWHDYLASSWQTNYFPSSGMGVFREFWNKSLSDGVFSYRSPETAPLSFNAGVLARTAGQEAVAEGFEIILAENVAMGTGAHANNPWLMELPDPVTRQCWENVASFSPKDAADLGIVNGQLVKIGNDITIPAYIQPGQAEQTISIALGYGHDNHGPVANGNGVNVFGLARYSDGMRKYSFAGAEVTVTGENRPLALMQLHDSQEGRPLARETTLTKYLEDPSSGNHLHFEFQTQHKSLYPDAPFDGFHWSIAIDLNACIGCNTCVIACQAENNTPTVGRDEVSRNRIMHWIKVHRYYSGSPDNPEVIFQPVFCQHCDDAPCENVCPVSATTHSNEGLNQMTYNRCVGTKYCMNNCPYRVRRFNWFRYTGNKEFDYNAASELGKMVLNPDVTVRERGVVEKCSFCVQRIQAAKLRAKLEGRVLNDMEIKPACMQACPAGAIIFGDTNNKNSRVSQLFSDKRRYGLLEQLHTLPSVGFLTKVRNDRG